MPPAIQSGSYAGTFPLDLLTGRPILGRTFVKPDGTPLYPALLSVDHTWEGDDVNNREIDLGDDYDWIFIYYEESAAFGVDHLALAYAFRTVYGTFRQIAGVTAMLSDAQVSADSYFQGKMTGGDANKIKLGTVGSSSAGTNVSGKTYRLIGLKFDSMA